MTFRLSWVVSMSKEKLAKRTRFAPNHKEEIYDPFMELPARFADFIDLRPGWSPEHLLPEHIITACKNVIEGFSYYKFFGLSDLKQAIAEKLERENGIDINPKTQVLVTTGGLEAIWLTIWTLIDPGDEVIMADPGYLAGYESNIEMVGGQVVHVPSREERHFKVDPADIQANISKKTKILVIISPENPTGAIYDKADLEAIADMAKEHDLIVLSDEIFEKLVYDGAKNLSIGAFPDMEERTLTLNGFTKGYNMAGYRIGYIVGPKVFIQKMANIQFHMTVAPNEIGQYAALAALNGPQNWLEETIKEYGKRRDLLVAELNKIVGVKCLKPEGGFTAFPNVKKFGMSSLEMVRHLMTHAHVGIHGGVPLFGRNSEDYVVIGFCRPLEAIRVGIERIKDALEHL